MTEPSLSSQRDERNAALLFVLVVVVGYSTVLANLPETFTSPPTLLLIGLGILYVSVGIAGESYCE